MLISKILIGSLLVPCAIFSGTIFSEMDKSNSYEMIAYYEEKTFNKTRSRMDQIASIAPSEQNFENTIGAFIKELSTLRSNFCSIKNLISSQVSNYEIEQQIQNDFKNFLRVHIIENEKLILVLEQYGQTTLNQEDITGSRRNLIVAMLEYSFPLFVSHVLHRNPAIQTEIKDYLLFCNDEDSKTKLYLEGKADSEGEKSVVGGINRKQEKKDGSGYTLDFNGTVKQGKDGKTKAEASAKIEIDF